jgi:dihydropteroate synthase
VPPDEELARVLPLVAGIARRFPEALISIDTFRSGIARAAVAEGATLVNDISGGHLDADMWATVAALRVPYIAMHSRGTPQTMGQLTDYDDLLLDIKDYFLDITERMRVLGHHDVLLDPGFGFAKTLSQNYALLKQMPYLQALGKPLVVGVSRKGMAYKPTGRTPETALAATTALHMLALQQGAAILRVHDVAEAQDAIAIHEAFLEAPHHAQPHSLLPA